MLESRKCWMLREKTFKDLFYTQISVFLFIFDVGANFGKWKPVYAKILVSEHITLTDVCLILPLWKCMTYCTTGKHIKRGIAVYYFIFWIEHYWKCKVEKSQTPWVRFNRSLTLQALSENDWKLTLGICDYETITPAPCPTCSAGIRQLQNFSYEVTFCDRQWFLEVNPYATVLAFGNYGWVLLKLFLYVSVSVNW